MQTNIEDAVIEVLAPEFEKKGLSIKDFSKDNSLITAGIIDSMTFINLLLELETKLNISLDFSSVDLNNLASIGGISAFFLKNSVNKEGL